MSRWILLIALCLISVAGRAQPVQLQAGSINPGANVSTGNVTATSGTTARALAPRFAETINVKDYGAVGDCSTDDSTAINAAITQIRNSQVTINNGGVSGGTIGIELDIPTACYVVTSSINMTSLRNFPTLINGHGALVWGKISGAPSFTGAPFTGDPVAVIDMMNDRFVTMRDLTVEGDSSATPNIGIMHGVISASPFSPADDNQYERVSTQGYFGFTSWYNRNSEETTFLTEQLRNAYAGSHAFTYVADGSNYWNVTSSFVANPNYPADTATTFLSDTWINADIRQTGGGHAVWMNGTTSHRFIASYFQTLPTTASYGITADTIASGGSGLSLCTAAFPAPNSGGVNATGTVTVAGGIATGIVITNPGSLYSNTPSSYVPTLSCTGGTPTANNPTLTTQGVEPLVLYDDLQSNSDLVLDVHMESGQIGNILFSQTTTGTYGMAGLTIKDREPFYNTAMFDNDSTVTAITLSLADITLGSTSFGGSLPIFANPNIWQISGKASLTNTGVWNRPSGTTGVSTMEIFGTVSTLNMGIGSYLVLDPTTGSIYLKGTIYSLAIAGTSGLGSALTTNSYNSNANGNWNMERSTQDAGIRGGSGNSNTWIYSIVGDGAGGVSLATGGTTAGGTVGLDVTSTQNVKLGLSAPAATATNGFPAIPLVATRPTGTPTALTGYAQEAYDLADNYLCFWNGSAWKCIAAAL